MGFSIDKNAFQKKKSASASGLVMLHMPLALVRCIKEAESQLVKQPSGASVQRNRKGPWFYLSEGCVHSCSPSTT
jgi:hypothetical protein